MALVCDGERLTYAELELATNRTAGALNAAGIAEGDRVAICGPNSWRWVVAYYAVVKLGAVLVPVHAKLTAREIVGILMDCNAKALIASYEVISSLQMSADTSLPDIMVLLGSSAESDLSSIDDYIERGPIVLARDVTPDRVSMICYTSGTTGQPKGAVLTYQSIGLNAAMTAQMHARSIEDRTLTALPCSHVYGGTIMNASMLMGGTLILESRFEVRRFLQTLRQERATIIDCVPATYLSILQSDTATSANFSSLRFATIGGQALAKSASISVEHMIGRPLIQLWGMTEIGGVGSTHPLNALNVHDSIGVPLPYTELRIANVQDPSSEAEEGSIGELMVRGPTRMLAYYQNEAATRESIDEHGWLATGDLARRDKDGRYYIVDRKKDLIVSGGYKIYPAEVENIIGSHPAVAAVGVGKSADAIKGEVPKAYVVLRPGATLELSEIVDFCRNRLAPYKIPRQLQIVLQLPETSTGKIMRRELSRLDPCANAQRD